MFTSDSLEVILFYADKEVRTVSSTFSEVYHRVLHKRYCAKDLTTDKYRYLVERIPSIRIYHNQGVCLEVAKDKALRKNLYYLKALTNITNDELRHLRKIPFLNLAKCKKITDASYLSEVKHLNLSASSVTNVSMLGNVKRLNLSFTNIKDVSTLGGVKALNLSSTHITDDMLFHLSKVKLLSLNRCINITDKGVSYLTEVKHLSLSHTNITDKCIQFLKNVRTLDLAYTSGIKGKTLHLLKSIRILSLRGVQSIERVEMRECTTLELLLIPGCSAKEINIPSSTRSRASGFIRFKCFIL